MSRIAINVTFTKKACMSARLTCTDRISALFVEVQSRNQRTKVLNQKGIAVIIRCGVGMTTILVLNKARADLNRKLLWLRRHLCFRLTIVQLSVIRLFKSTIRLQSSKYVSNSLQEKIPSG